MLGGNMFYIVGLSIIYTILVLFLHLILYITNVWIKYPIIIRLPKSKKYNKKVDPIYELRESDWNNEVYIYKWSLMYSDVDSFLTLLLLLIPYPIIIKKFGYNVENNVYICEKKNVIELGDDLKTIYENKMEKLKQEETVRRNKVDKVKDKFDKLNQIFNENYE